MVALPLYVNSAVYESTSLLVFLTLNEIAIYGAMMKILMMMTMMMMMMMTMMKMMMMMMMLVIIVKVMIMIIMMIYIVNLYIYLNTKLPLHAI